MNTTPPTIPKLAPIYHFIGGIIATPIIVLGCLLVAIALVICWPATPFLLFIKRRREIQAEIMEQLNRTR